MKRLNLLAALLTINLCIPIYAAILGVCKVKIPSWPDKSIAVYYTLGYEHLGPNPRAVGNQSVKVEFYDKDTLLNTFNYDNVTHFWDEHTTGLLTAPGFSMVYEPGYSLFGRATVTTFIGEPNNPRPWLETFEIKRSDCKQIE